jgi:hypothetical protein
MSQSTPISFEENSERLKIIIPLRRLWGYWLVYSLLLLAWLGGTLLTLQQVVALIQRGNYGFEGLLLLAYLVILLILAGGWLWVGRQIWRRWQYYTANREILFFYEDKLIVRRPLSLLGITEAYDRKHVSPFRFDEKMACPVFDYGSYRIPIGTTLPPEEAQALIEQINQRFFAEMG